MREPTNPAATRIALVPYLSPLAVWAMSVGSAIGWGSLVVTSRTYLTQAGSAGTISGLLIGLAMMVMVSMHYHFLANHYLGIGGLYDYVRYIFDDDRAFLVAWYLFLVYISLFWANATSIPLFARYFLGGAFSRGHLYTIFGYDVYLGEVLVAIAAIVLVTPLCARGARASARDGGAGGALLCRYRGVLRCLHGRACPGGHVHGTGLRAREQRVSPGRAHRFPVALGLHRL